MTQTTKTEYTGDTLLKYDPPVINELTSTKKVKKDQAPVQANPQQWLVDYLDQIFPPKKSNDGTFDYIQHASTASASRSDIIALEEQLDHLLKEKKARATGICPIRAELFDDCFNEIIRQVAVDCTERATLLIDIRNEIQETISGYKKQYESITAHGIRGAIHREQNKNNLIKENEKLEADIKAFEDKIADLKKRMADADANDIADQNAKRKEHSDKLAQLQADNAALRKKLEDFLVSPVVIDDKPPAKK
ncbi:hypothetical protein TVAG_357850 [Trichomonas vaginalis G3]|uniref:Uncharacterized protein n=1 Tax=Trichomonas vaginalis (strain ATCC PRA-98 / G3) TaxID=412133 RepID=A2F3D2_TRIV3|nr:dynein heavy chain binding [Trichomonas vaginalis G3]EAY00579.1 hypothetical protein TVAG_357850 [Trichomonas vaginalis G3]KAI5547886.1 dynein heavy chain binding [Trichomonas vaginalis G3]|eukprot:XP_001313508.1 hypothetical protein [Trichomonas vaginalis G3]